MWRKVLIILCSLLIIACLILIGNINSIITNEESARNTLTAVFEANKLLRPFLEFEDLNEQEQERFMKLNKTLLSEHGYDPVFCQKLYNNKRFIDIFGKDAFYSSINKFGNDAYDYRCEILHIKVVLDAFSYLYSPYKKNGFRDNAKGLGSEWEKYNQMSISSKENFIRSDFQERFERIVEKENYRRKLLGNILFSIVLVSGLSIFCLIARKTGKKNIHARNMALYIIICLILGFLIYSFMAIDNPAKGDTFAFVAFVFLPSVVVLSMMEVFLSRKSHQDYNDYYLIPEWLLNNLNISNEFRKRLLMVFLIYPFFFIVPLPIVGMLFLVCYILPVLLILGIIRGVMWIKEGKRMDATPQAQNDKARLYCRHCGKLIDADSDFCRYCGNKL